MVSFQYSLKNAVVGLLATFRTERNFKIHIGIMIGIVILGVGYRIALWKWAYLAISITIVLVAELFNTAIERVVDLASPTWNNQAGMAKDIAAGAVLISAIHAVIAGCLIFGPT